MKIRNTARFAFAGRALAVVAAFSGTTVLAQDAAAPATDSPAAEPAVPAAAATPPKADLFKFGGYWRLGYNTDINPLNANTSGHGSSIPTSRHTRDPSYFRFDLSSEFGSGAKAVLGIDSPANAVPHYDDSWSDDSELQVKNLPFRVRDLYLQLPVSEGVNIWAGSRRLEFEDIRIFDKGSFWDTNGYGIGADFDKTSVALSYEQAERSAPNATAGGARQSVDSKNVSLLARHTIELGEGLALKPMLKLNLLGGSPDRVTGGATSTSVKSTDTEVGFIAGAVLSRWGGENWGNTQLAVEMGPAQKENPAANDPDYDGSDMAIRLGDTGSYDFGVAGLLTSVYASYFSFENKSQVYKVANDAIVPDGDKTSDSTVDLAIALQPVFYVTDRFHTALDLAYSMRTEKISAGDANVFTATPILRYAMNKNPLGTPQIYTSISYGLYDAKVKTDAEGKATDSLLTTQTGFEIWF